MHRKNVKTPVILEFFVLPRRLRMILFLFLLTFSGIMFGQDEATIDSIRNAIATAESDSMKLVLIEESFRPMVLHSAQEGLEITKEGLRLAQKLNLKEYEAQMHYNLAMSHERNRSPDNAIEEYLKSREYYKTVEDSAKLYDIHSALMSRYNDKGDIDESLRQYDLAKSFIRSGEFLQEAKLNNRLAIVFGMQGNFELAAKYFRNNLPIYREAQDPYGLGFTHMNIGICLDEMGQLDSAQYYLEEGVKWNRQANYPTELALNLRELSHFHTNKNEFAKATIYLTEAGEILEKNGSLNELSSVKSSTAELWLKQDNLDQAIKFAQEGLDISDQMNQPYVAKELLRILSSAHADQENYERAYYFANRRLVNQDSLFSTENRKVIRELEEQFKTREQQAQLEAQDKLLSRQKNVNRLAILSAILLLGILVALFMAYRQRQKKNELLKKQAETLKELDQAKSRFFANISHELKTPLSLIKGPLEMAIDRSGNNKISSDLKIARDNSERLLNLVDEIMDLSRLESGKLTLQPVKSNLYHLTSRIISAFRSLCEIRKIHLTLDYHLPHELEAEIDIGKFEKILNNLLSNAIKFTPSDGSVKVEVSSPPDDSGGVHIAVSDTGMGITQEDQEKIFQRFYQGDDKGTLQGGTGIGLALTAELVKLMNGTIKVYSRTGHGSRFTVSLPLKTFLGTVLAKVDDTANDTGIQEVEYRPVSIFDDQPSVLIVEDNKEMNDFIHSILSPYFRCSQAYNGTEGIKMLARGTFDCVTCDVMMPEMDGFTFIKKLRQSELSTRIPVIMLTARSLEEDLLKGFSLGVDDYLTKPFRKNELIARLNTLISNKRYREEWVKENKTEEKVDSFEKTQLEQAEQIVLDHLSDDTFKVEQLARQMNYSVRQLERILRKLTGLTPSRFIREIRLQKAHKLIESRRFATIAEVRLEVGIPNASYFSKIFQERFGVKPGELSSLKNKIQIS